jgi:ABC-2 type transport system ATP-binding protein
MLREQGYAQAALFGSAIHVLSQAPDADMQKITQELSAGGLAGVEVKPRPLSMEDVFVYHVTTLEAQDQPAREAA